MTYRGYKSWRPNSRKDRRRARGGTQSRARKGAPVARSTDKVVFMILGGFLLLVILAMLAFVLLG